MSVQTHDLAAHDLHADILCVRSKHRQPGTAQEAQLMTRSETDAGTPIIEFDAKEYTAFLDQEARKRMGMSAEEFTRRYLAGDLDDVDPDVPLLVGLLGIGQNGHHAAA
jgi:hypothetical protein